MLCHRLSRWANIELTVGRHPSRTTIPADKACNRIVGSMLGHCQRRWPIIKPTLVRRKGAVVVGLHSMLDRGIVV